MTFHKVLPELCQILRLSTGEDNQMYAQTAKFIMDLYEGSLHITKTCLNNFDPLKPHFYKVKLGFTGVYIISLISAQKHRLWVLVRTASAARRF